MARPERFDADYFPFFAKDGRTLTILQHKHGLAGIGFFTNVLRMLTVTPHHFVELTVEADRLYAFSKIGCSEEEGTAMIELMVSTGKLDAELWRKRRVLFSADLAASLAALYRKRNFAPPTSEDVWELTARKPPLKARKLHKCRVNGAETPVSSVINTQSRVKERKGEESIDKTSVGKPDDAPSETEPEEQEPIPYREIVDRLNEKTNARYRHSSKQAHKFIKARWNEGFRLPDFFTVIETKADDWLADPQMARFLRPETLFNPKFESYLQGDRTAGANHSCPQICPKCKHPVMDGKCQNCDWKWEKNNADVTT